MIIPTEVKKTLLYISSATVLFWPLTPSSLGIYEFIVGFIFIFLIIDGAEIEFPPLPVLLGLFLILLGYTISMVNSQSNIEALKFPIQFGFISFVQFTVLYTLTDTRRDVINHALALMTSFSILSAIFLISLVNGIPTDRITLIYTNPNVMATHIFPLTIIAASMGWYLFKTRSNKSPNSVLIILFAALTTSGVVVILFSQSRRALIGFATAALIAVIILLRKEYSISKLVVRSVFSLIGIITMITGLVISGLISESFLLRIDPRVEDGALEYRTVPIRLGLRAASESLFLGTGYNNFEYVMNDFVVHEWESLYVHKPHNLFLMPLVEGGIIAMIGALLLFSYITIQSIRRVMSGVSQEDIVPVSFIAAAVAYIVAHQFGVFEVLRMNWLIIILSLISITVLNEDNTSET